MSARSRKLLAICAVVLVLLGVFLGWKTLFPSEPVYQGKPLSAWAEQWGTNHWKDRVRNVQAKEADREAEEAIQHIGTNGIPFLLNWMGVRESTAKTKLRAMLPHSWHARLHLEDQTGKLKVTGAHGLAALGTNAGPAVPGLMELASMEMTRNPPDRNNGYLPVWTLGYLWGAAEPAVPLLVQGLTNQDQSIRLDAAHSLGMIRRRPDIAVPALVARLDFQKDTPGSAERHAAVQSISQFGTNAASALPAFIALLRDADSSIREHATNSLPYIDRAAAERLKIRIPWER